MYAFLSEMLSDKKGGITFSCFGIWHLCYLIIVIAAVVITVVYLKNKDKEVKDKVSASFINCAFGLYIADFFIDASVKNKSGLSFLNARQIMLKISSKLSSPE